MQHRKPQDVTGIIGAMESEVAAVRHEMNDAQVSTLAGMDFVAGSIAGNSVVLAQCGIGKVNAAVCAQLLISSFGATRIINTGVAGSLTNKLSINDFVVSTDAVQHDYDICALGYAPGEVPYTGIAAFPADEGLRGQAVAAVRAAAPRSTVLEGRVCSGDQFISTPAQRDAIVATFGGLCAEMEGAAIAQVCYLNQVPYVIIRAISDDSDDMAFTEFQAEAARECAGAVLTMMRGPEA